MPFSTIGLEIILDAPNGPQVEARFRPFGDSVSGARFVPNKAWKSFWKHTMELLRDEAQVES